MLRWHKFVACAAVAILALPLAGQQPATPPQKQPPESEPQFRIRTRAELVVVPVTVKDAAGQLVTNVTADEFRVFEDGVEQQISVFSAEAFPLSVVVLLDDALQTREAEILQKTAPVLSAGFSEQDEVAVMLFDEFPRPLLEFTRDNDKLYDHLKRMQVQSTFPGVGSGPMTAGPKINQTSPEPRVVTRAPTSKSRQTKNLDDAVYAAGRMLRDRGRERRKIIFLISDGTNSNRNEYTFDETLKLLLTADISVYSVSLNPLPLSGVRNPLAAYAKLTGGDYYQVKTRDELERRYALVTEQARNQYTLAYVPRDTDRKKEFHLIEVRVRRPSLHILCRDGYYAAPAP